MKSSFINIQAKVYVLDDDLTQEEFEELAKERIEELIPDDNVLKINDIEFISPSQ